MTYPTPNPSAMMAAAIDAAKHAARLMAEARQAAKEAAERNAGPSR